MTTTATKTVTEPSSTAGVTSQQLEALTGKHIRIIPFSPTVHGEEFLIAVWAMMKGDPKAPRTLWRAHGTAWRLQEFLNLMNDPSHFLVIGQVIETGQPMGFIWFDQVIPSLRAFGAIYVKKDYRGKFSQEFLWLTMRYAFDVLKLKAVWGITPWIEAIALIKRVGFQSVAHLPHFTVIDEQPHDVWIYKLTKEHFNGQE